MSQSEKSQVSQDTAAAAPPDVDANLASTEIQPDELAPDRSYTSETDWVGRLINGATMVLLMVVVLMGYHFLFVAPNKQKFAVVDLSEVLNIKELQVTIAAMRPDATDDSKSKAYDEVAKFGKDVEVALNELQQECDCSIFVKAAVIKSAGSEDLTPKLKQRLAMENINPAELVKQLRTMGGGGRSPIMEGNDK